MKTSYKLISLLLTILLLLPTIAACDSASKNEETTQTQNESAIESNAEESASETEEVVLVPCPENDYGADFFLLIHNDSNRFEYHWVEESSNDVLSQAIFDRQQKVYNHLGVNVEATKALATFNYIEPFKNAVKNKDGSVDMLLTHVYHGIDGFVTGNYLTDFNNIPSVNIDADYWNLDIIEEASFNGSYYLAKNDFNILYTHAITFNKDLMAKYEDAMAEDVYTMVENYRWTLDRMISVAELVYIDANSDGKSIDDTFGIAGECNVPVIGFLHACDINMIEQNEKGEYSISVYNEMNQAKTTDLTEKLRALVASDCAWLWTYGSGENLALEKGTSLMMLTSTNHLPNLLNYDINFGVLPYPMYDEEQKDVGYRSLQWGGYTCVPSYVSDINMVGDTIEMLAYFSDGVNEAFYEKLIGKQVAESPIDKKMLEIIWDGICTDFAQTYYGAISGSQFLYMLPELTKSGSTLNLSSYVASAEKSVNKLLKKLTLTAGK